MTGATRQRPSETIFSHESEQRLIAYDRAVKTGGRLRRYRAEKVTAGVLSHR